MVLPLPLTPSPGPGRGGREGLERPRWPKMALRWPQRAQDDLQDGSGSQDSSTWLKIYQTGRRRGESGGGGGATAEGGGEATTLPEDCKAAAVRAPAGCPQRRPRASILEPAQSHNHITVTFKLALAPSSCMRSVPQHISFKWRCGINSEHGFWSSFKLDNNGR